MVRLVFGLAVGLWVGQGAAWGQSAAAASATAGALGETSVEDALRTLQSRAAVAFAGQVVAVRPADGVVEIDFRVGEVLKGSPGTVYTLREWAGLWAAGQRRFWVGERAVVFLHAAGSGGLGSPVDGMEGVLPLEAPASVVKAAADAAPELAVDVRRLQTRVVRAVGSPMVAGAGTLSLAALRAVVEEGAKAPVLPGERRLVDQPREALHAAR